MKVYTYLRAWELSRTRSRILAQQATSSLLSQLFLVSVLGARQVCHVLYTGLLILRNCYGRSIFIIFIYSHLSGIISGPDSIPKSQIDDGPLHTRSQDLGLNGGDRPDFVLLGKPASGITLLCRFSLRQGLDPLLRRKSTLTRLNVNVGHGSLVLNDTLVRLIGDCRHYRIGTLGIVQYSQEFYYNSYEQVNVDLKSINFNLLFKCMTK